MTNAISEEFPAYPPYSGMYDEIIPHLTIADTSADEADIAEHGARNPGTTWPDRSKMHGRGPYRELFRGLENHAHVQPGGRGQYLRNILARCLSSEGRNEPVIFGGKGSLLVQYLMKEIVMKKTSEIKKRFKKLLNPHLNDLFFPHGVNGRVVYYLEKNGYHGPDTIPGYVVPVCFSSEALLKLKDNSEKLNIPVKAAQGEDLDKLVEGIDLTYGTQRKLDPLIFTDMVSSGCKPDVYYLDKGFNNGQYSQFFDFLIDKIWQEYALIPWEDLEPADMKFWCYMFTHAPTTVSRRNNNRTHRGGTIIERTGHHGRPG